MPGIGKKTAERLLLELKGKLGPDLAPSAARLPDAHRSTSSRRWWLWATATRKPRPQSSGWRRTWGSATASNKPSGPVTLSQAAHRAALGRAACDDLASGRPSLQARPRCPPERANDMSIQTDDLVPSPRPRVVSAAPGHASRKRSSRRALRPKPLDEYVGQSKAARELEIFIGAARKREEALDHVLLFGPPGLGKTTLSHIIAAELGVNLRQTSGPVLEKPKDLAAILTNLERNDVLFIDESPAVPGGRGNPIPPGGLPDRHHDR